MNDIIKKIKSTKENIAICWLGNDGWLIGHDGHLIAFDLDLTSSIRLYDALISPEELADELDYLFISHAHGDHFNTDTCSLIMKGKCRFVLPVSCEKEARDIKIPESRIKWVKPNEKYNLSSWLKVETVRALHGHIDHSIYKFANMMDCGYLLDFGGKIIFQPGDSVLLQQHLEMESVDILFVSPTEHNTHIDDSITLINAINPKYIFTQHFDTYLSDEDNAFWTVGYPKELKAKLDKKLKNRLTIPQHGKLYYI